MAIFINPDRIGDVSEPRPALAEFLISLTHTEPPWNGLTWWIPHGTCELSDLVK